MMDLEANQPPEDDEDAKRVWEMERREAFRVFLFARRTVETGEDVEAMLRKFSDGSKDQ